MIEFHIIIYVENWDSTRNLYLQKHILKLRICETRLEIVYVASNIFSSKIFMWDTTRSSVLSSFQVWDSSGSAKCAAQLHLRRCFLFLKVVIVVLETVSVDQGRWSDLFWSRKMFFKWNSSAASCDNLLELSTRIEIYF